MKRYSQNIFDLLQKYPGFVMMLNTKKSLPIDDKSAETLYNLWKSNTEKKITATTSDQKSLTTLVEKGYVRKAGNSVELTEKGKTLVLEIGLSSPNALCKAPMPTYSDIKTKSAKRERRTFVKKASNDIPAFNLKVERKKNDSTNKKQIKSKGT